MRYDASYISFDGILRKEILMTLLDVKHVQKIYKTRFQGNQVEALKDIHFTVEKGDYVAIMVTHDRSVLEYVDTVYEMKKGKLVRL